MSAGDIAPYCLIVQPVDNDPGFYEARWVSYDPSRDDGKFCGSVPEHFIDLMPYMVGRELLGRGYDPNRDLVVKLYGSDRTLLHVPLAVAAATPIPNFGKPVKEPAGQIYSRRIEE